MKILDATAGNRSIWFDPDHIDAIFMDIRPEVSPDIVGDCTKTEFPSFYFDLIVFDPPHVSLSKNNIGIFGEKYGRLPAKEIRDLVKNAFKEFHRILKNEGLVMFKWNDHDQKLPKILKLITNFEALFGQKVSERSKHSSRTYWVCLKKK